jgi:hypothetical protein
MQNNTPSYYPQSPRWGLQNSPGFGNTECKPLFILNYTFSIDGGGGMSPAVSRPGSEYAGANLGGHTRGAPNYLLKKE